jgi:phage tail tape-measure protein
MTTENLLKWVVPIVLLFVLLVATQVFLGRRFRRAVNPPLLAATVVLIGLSIVASLAVVSQHRLENSRSALYEVVLLWREQPSAADVQGQQALGELMEKECGGANGGCGPTVDQFVSNHKSAGNTTEKVTDKRPTKRIGDYNDRVKSASENADWKNFILVLAGLILALIPLGLLPRIEEYRYRPR